MSKNECISLGQIGSNSTELKWLLFSIIETQLDKDSMNIGSFCCSCVISYGLF